MTGRDSFWDRLAARTVPSGALVSMENSNAIVRMAFAWTLGAIPGVAFVTGIFIWFDEPVAARVQVVLAGFYVLAWLYFARTGRTRGTYLMLSLVSVIATIVVHVSLGGYANSGGFLMWGIPMAIVAILLLDRREAIVVGASNAALAIALGFLEPGLRASRDAPDATMTAILFAYNLTAVIVLVVPVVGLLVSRLSYERERAEELLLNVLPQETAMELKETGATESRRFESITVLFADIVGFTPMAAEMEPSEMVARLDEVFSHFDALAIRYGCEKIRTIGDAYMVAAGVPTATDGHAQAIASMALDMLAYAEVTSLTFRLGINSGPAVAGVVGTSKFQYDIWGDTVNTASRMESHGEPGRIQISEATYELIKDDFDTTSRGAIEVKGKGSLTTWFLDGARDHMTPQVQA